MSVFQEKFMDFLQNNMVVAVVILAVLVVRFLLRKLPKKYSYFLWCIIGLRMLFQFNIQSVFSLFNFCPIDVTSTTNQAAAAINSSNEMVTPPATGSTGAGWIAGNTRASGLNTANMSASGNVTDSTMIILGLIWIAGMAALLLYHVRSYIHLKKQVRNAVLLRNNIYECDGITTPFILGFLSPKIYIPFGLEEEEQRYILAHEAYHLKRKDHFFKLLAFLLLIIYWINPLVWIAYFCFVRDQEMSCDEAVLLTFGNGIKQAYSTSLLSFATGKRQHMFVPLAFGESDAAKRIKHVLNFKKPHTWAAVVAILAIVAIAVTCLTSRKETAPDANSKIATESSEIEQSEPADHTLTMELLQQLVRADDWKSKVSDGKIDYWAAFDNVTEDKEFHEDSLTGLYRCRLSHGGIAYELQVYYWPESTARQYDEVPDCIDSIFLCNGNNGDSIRLYTNESGPIVTDIDEFLTRTYDITKSISFDEIRSTELSGTITLGDYTTDLFNGFSGSSLVCDQYQEPQHGDSASPASYSLGGIGEWKEPEEWAFTYNGEELSSATLWGNHMSQEEIASFRSDSFYGLLYQYDFDLYTAADLDETSDPNLQTNSQYWVAYLSAGPGEPVYVLYLNSDYFTREETLQWAKSVTIPL